MNGDVLRAINTQINSEFRAWYQYLAMSAFCEREKFTARPYGSSSRATKNISMG